ncbi:MAG: Ada metal-binding domain-containing protein [Cyanobacteriota bacterium]
MITHIEISNNELRVKIKQKELCFGGNINLKIYGTLECKSGKRMKKINRVFFTSELEAIKYGFRPCGHCMRTQYQEWKNAII